MPKNEQAEAAAPKSTAELLELARARVAKLEQRQTTENVLNALNRGDKVSFRFGRNIPERVNKAGETVAARSQRILEGEVLGVQDQRDEAGNLTGKIVKVQAGEGFDADVYKVNARDITSVGGADTTQDEEAREDEDGLTDEEARERAEAVAANGGPIDGEDPLNQE